MIKVWEPKGHHIRAAGKCFKEQNKRSREAIWKAKGVNRRQDGVLSGCLVSSQSSNLSTGGCGGFIKVYNPSPCTWVIGPSSITISSKWPRIIPLLFSPSAFMKPTRDVLLYKGKEKKEVEKLGSGISLQILRGPWALIIQSLSFQLGWSPNEVRAVLLLAGCTSKEGEEGSGMWVMVSIWLWPQGLWRWRYAVRTPWHLLVARLFRAYLHKSERPIALEEVSFHLKAKRRWKTFPTTMLVTLDFRMSPKMVGGNGGKGGSQRVKLADQGCGWCQRCIKCCWNTLTGIEKNA